MGKLIGLMTVAFAAFAAAAAGTWWWQQQQTARTAAPTPPASAESSTGDAVVADVSAAPVAEAPLPVAVRPRPMSVEELIRYGLSLNARDDSLQKQEDALRQRVMQVQLALADLQTEQASLDAIRAQVQQQLQAADGLLARIQQGRQELVTEQARAKSQLEEFKTAQLEMDEQERENIKRLATWVRAMDPSNAGDVLKEMANDGRMATAVKILSNLEEREAAKILDSLSDSTLIDSFIQEYQKLRTPAKRSARR